MDIKTFNELFYVSVITLAVQSVTRIMDDNGETELEYGGVDEFLNNLSYKVYDNETHECLFEIETDSDDDFLHEVEEWFNDYLANNTV